MHENQSGLVQYRTDLVVIGGIELSWWKMANVVFILVQVTLVITAVIGSGCDENNGDCSHNCQPTDHRRNVCTCRNGYQLNSTNLKSCFGIFC